MQRTRPVAHVASQPRPTQPRRELLGMIRRLLRRSPAEWALALRAVRYVVSVRVSLWRWPYARVRARLAAQRAARWRGNGTGEAPTLRDPRALAWAVRATSRWVPRASCLTQALALEALLTEAGEPCRLRIGVARRDDGSFEAHAWVELAGQVLIGGVPNMERFSVLPESSHAAERALEP